MKELWKQFENLELTHSTAHYLMAVHELLDTQGYARAVDVARYLNISRGSVSLSLNRLKKLNFLKEDANKFLQMTEKGHQVVHSVLQKRQLIIQFLKEVLLIPEATAESDACKIEHLISDETGKRLMSFLGYYLSRSPEAVHFREGFQNFLNACNQYADCSTCELECYFAGKQSEDHNQ